MARDDTKMADFDRELEDWCFEADDHLKRQDTADFLTSFLVAESAERCGDRQRKGEGKSYVLNLNAEWGAGKTTFLKCWRTHLRSKQHPVVYVDAWRHDFCQDPLAVLLSDIQKQLLAQVKGISGFKNRLEKSFEALKPIALEGLAALVKGGAHWFAGEAGSRFAGIVGDAVTNGLEGMADVAVRQLLAEQQTRVQAMAEFQSAMAKLTTEIAKAQATQLPVFIFVDELDRCRPTYAVEMLELIKHLFDIPNWVFVIATDTDQLQHTVAGLYGAGFNGSKYLERFFNIQFHLEGQTELSTLVDTYLERKGINYVGSTVLPNDVFYEVLSFYTDNPRTIFKHLDRFNACVKARPELNHFILICMIVVHHHTQYGQNLSINQPLPGHLVVLPISDEQSNNNLGNKVFEVDEKVTLGDLLKMIFSEVKWQHGSICFSGKSLDVNSLACDFYREMGSLYRRDSFAEYWKTVKLATQFVPKE